MPVDPRSMWFDIVLGGFFVENIGINYLDDTMVELRDRDTGNYNGDVEPIIVDGRIVGVDIINTGTGYKRIPEVIITSKRGRGAKLYPIMDVITKTELNPRLKKFQKSVQFTYCSSVNRNVED